MSTLKYSDENLDEIFTGDLEGKVKVLYFGHKDFISCFAVKFNTESEVMNSWSIIQNLISVKYLRKTNLTKWNLYLFIFCQEKMDLKKKYLVQNDKFSMRKVIVDHWQSSIDSPQTLQEISNEINGDDIFTTLNKTVPKNIKFEPSILVRNVSKLDISSKQNKLNLIEKLILELKDEDK